MLFSHYRVVNTAVGSRMGVVDVIHTEGMGLESLQELQTC